MERLDRVAAWRNFGVVWASGETSWRLACVRRPIVRRGVEESAFQQRCLKHFHSQAQMDELKHGLEETMDWALCAGCN
ncbi:hypothetical protein FNV43_RR04217 [Rhamnella rubrinervis]|uniref:Uncharacterized protein n=1 Tax=Rhamnella rubrinervis TaxID=2594499 RepID=A0A8K0HJT7_9ROSA|nr:hypothetical protein FNV43_RR04217 [Rhamnella rubrinervis]